MSAMRIKLKPRSGPSRSGSPQLVVPSRGTSYTSDGGHDEANREVYLQRAAKKIGAVIETLTGLKVPPVRVSCGFPYGMRGSKKFVGQCWDSTAAKDGKPQVFISPFIDDTTQVLAVLTHELLHAAVGPMEGHGAAFSQAANKVGFLRPWRQVVMGSGMVAGVEDMRRQIGDYPHAKLELEEAEKSGAVKHQNTRMVKLTCPKSGYSCRTTRKWLDLHGAPLSPVTKKVMVEVTP